jgi:hypothetical protein
MKKIQFLFFLVFMSFKVSYGQVKTALDSLKGTYQIQISGYPRNAIALPDNVAEIIKTNRSADKIVYSYIQPNVRIKILPLLTINCVDFVPLPVQTMVKEFTNE